MKRMYVIFLVIVFCLSLCACQNPGEGQDGAVQSTAGESTQTETNASTQPTEDPQIAQQKKSDYERALRLLASSASPGYESGVRTAYELLTALGDYEQAQAYLDCITVIPDMLIRAEYYNVNAFGEENLIYPCYYGYDREGRLLFGVGTYQEMTYSFYSYNELDQIDSVRVAWTDGSTRAVHTYVYDGGELAAINILWDDGSLEERIYENGLLVRQKGEGYSGTFTYDENGLLLKEEWGSVSIGEYEYEFDADGNVIRSVAHFKSGGVTVDDVREYTYENGRLATETFEEYGYTYKIVYTYGDYYCYTPAE